MVLVSGEPATVFECFQRAKINILSREVLFIQCALDLNIV